MLNIVRTILILLFDLFLILLLMSAIVLVLYIIASMIRADANSTEENTCSKCYYYNNGFCVWKHDRRDQNETCQRWKGGNTNHD
jgi:uncharacterized membrane protein YqjE